MTYRRVQQPNIAAAIVVSALILATSNARAAFPLLTGGASGTLASNSAVNQLIAEADKALKAGNLPLALIHLKNATSAAPRNGNVRARLGIALLQYGDYYSTERELRQARKDGAPDQMVLPPLFQVMLLQHEAKTLLDEFPDPGQGQGGPTAPDLLKARALALQDLGQSAEAADAMDKSLKLRRDTQGLLTRARLAQKVRDFPLAKSLTDEAIKISHGSADPMLFKVSLLMDANDTTGALDLANQLVAKFPNNLSARFPRIDVLMRLKQDAKAKTDVDTILTKSPGLAIGVYYRALLMARAGNTKGAWHLAQTLPPEFTRSQPGIALMVGQIADGSGNTETGAAILSSAIQKFPDDVGLRLRLAGMRLKQNAPEGAMAALDPLKDSTDPRVTGALSNIYLRLHKYDEALEILEKLNQTGQGTDASKRNVGLLEMQLGRSDQAIKDLAQDVSQQPANAQLVGPFIFALIQNSKFSEALSAADRLGSDPKQRVQGLIFRAQVLLAQQNVDGALAAFDKAVQLEPKNVGGLYGRATLLISLQRYGEANRDLLAIRAIDPKNMTVQLKLAEVAADQGQDQNVRNILGQSVAIAPQNPTPRIALARYLMAKRDFKGAVATLNDLLRVQPKDTEGLAFLGQAQMAMGQKSDAVKTFQRLVTIAPNAAAAQVLLGNALFGAGDRGGATRSLQAAVKLDPTSAEVRTAQIDLQFASGDLNGAISTARAFQSSNPSTQSDIVLGDTLAKAKRPDEAMTVLKKSLAGKPNNIVLMRLVRLSVQSGDKKSATEFMSSWLEKNPGDVGVRVDYATLLMQNGNKVEAANQYQLVLKRDPNNISSLNNLSWLKQRDDPRRALALITSASKLAPNAPEILDTLGWLKLQQKDASGGLPLLDRAHQLKPKDGDISYHLVVALNANGKRDLARALLQNLLASGENFEDRQTAMQLSAAWH